MIEEVLKKCRTCEVLLPLDKFCKSSATPSGKQGECKTCNTITRRKYREADEEHAKEYRKSYRNLNKENLRYRLQALLNTSKARAKEKQREHTIKLQDLLDVFPLDGKCPIFGFDLCWNSKGFRETSPSIDRIDSDKGYTPDNIQIISWKANRIKGYATVEDLEVVLSYLKQGKIR